MAKYKVYEVEEKMTSTGKALKKLVLQAEGKQYPEKNVTMWANHPLYEEIVPGQTIDVEIESKDSTTPNPHGGFYKNKTVLGSPALQKRDFGPAAKDPATQELKNLLTIQILPLLQQNNAGIQELILRIKALNDRINTFINATADEGEITGEDIPFG